MDIQWGLKGLQETINIHPLFVHFPIALLLTSFASYLMGSFIKKDELLVAGKWLLFFGTLAAAVTVWTGLQAEKTVPHGGGVHQTMIVHKYFGFSVLTLSLLLSAWVLLSKTNIPNKGKAVFFVVLAVLAVLIIQGADLGGRMVFLYGVGVKSKMQQPTAHDDGGGHDHGAHGHGGHH